MLSMLERNRVNLRSVAAFWKLNEKSIFQLEQNNWVNKVELNCKEKQCMSQTKVYYSLLLNEFPEIKNNLIFRFAHMCHMGHRCWRDFNIPTEGSNFGKNSIKNMKWTFTYDANRQTEWWMAMSTKLARRETRKLILNLVFDWNN